MSSSGAFATPHVGPLTPARSTPVPPPPPEPAKPLVAEAPASLVSGKHAKGVLYEPNTPLTPSTYAAPESAGPIAAVNASLAPLSPPERPPLSDTQRRATALYGTISTFTA